MKSVMQFAFDMLPKININRSTFDLSHGHKTTGDAGYLIPIDVQELYPGDTFNCRVGMFIRMQSMVKPVMDNIWVDQFHFFVPSRLLWTHFKNFLGEKATPDDTTEYILPTISGTTGQTWEDSVFMYMGIPRAKFYSGDPIMSLPFRAYNMIWNEYFRDQNLQDPVTVETGDTDDPAHYLLLRRCKRHDYFNGCLPWPQKGDAIDVPLGSSAPVYGNDRIMKFTDGTHLVGIQGQGTSTFPNTTGYGAAVGAHVGDVISSGGSSLSNTLGIGYIQKSTIGTSYSGDTAMSGLYADLSDATAATINQLRQAFQAQKMLEKDARGGTRMKELILMHFGVDNGDARLQRPEFLGTSSDRININPIAQTSASGLTGGTTKQGDLTAYGTGAARGGYMVSATEHGFIISLLNIRADLTYQYGLRRMWSRSTRDDLYWPSYAHLGEQAVLNKEIYADGSADDELPWGYNERYAELRHCPSIITGQFNPTYLNYGSMDVYHLASTYTDTPILSDEYIQDNPPIDRVIAVPGTQQAPMPQFLIDIYFKMTAARPMPLYSIPGLIDHF